MQIQNPGFPPRLQDAVCCIFIENVRLTQPPKKSFSIHICYKTINKYVF